MSISFAVESYSLIRDEVAPLAVAHWQETEEAMYGSQTAVPMTHPMYEAMEQGGVLHVVTARVDGVLHGYAAYCLSENLNMPGRVTASALALYMSREIRADAFAALRLLRWAEDSLRQRGVSGIGYNSPASRPCDALYRRLGARITETVWYKEL